MRAKADDASGAEPPRDSDPKASRRPEAAVAAALRQDRNRLWREANGEALDAYAREIEREGLPLAGFRSF